MDTEEIERWFIGKGVPHFIDGYRARTNVWTRAAPALLVLWLIGLASEFGFSERAGLATLFGGGAVVVALFVAANKLRHRAAFARPDDVGAAELGLFVFAPAALSVALGHRGVGVAVSIATALVILGTVYLTTSYGIISITRYVLAQLGDQLRLIGDLSSRALPLLLLVSVSVFMSAETWQLSSNLVGVSQVATIALFVFVGGAFLLSRAPRVVDSIATFAHWDEIGLLLQGTPASGASLPPGSPPEQDLNRGQRTNMAVMTVARQAVQITLVVLTVSMFFVLLGLVSIHPDTAKAWIGEAPNVLVSANVGASTFALTEELLRVSAFLGAFSGLAFTVSLVTDQTYREEFRSDVSDEIRQLLAVRVVYLDAIRRQETSSG